MFKAISPVGHPLSWTQILGVSKKVPRDTNFLLRCFPSSSVFPVSSGTAALTVSLLILKKTSPKNEVILPAYSCPSLVAAVVKAGLTPVLCDMQPSRLTLDLERLAAVVGPQTLAVIAVHLFGIPEDVSAIKKLAETSGFFVLEDAAQAFGNYCNALKGPYGALGDLGVISFGRGKPLNLLSGGAVILNQPALMPHAESVYASLPSPSQVGFLPGYILLLLLYSVFFHPRTHWLPRSIPFLKLGETYYIGNFFIGRTGPGVLGVGESVYKNFPEIRETRKILSQRYIQMLTPYSDQLSFIPDIESADDAALLRFPIIFRDPEKRNLLLSALLKNGLGATGSFPVPLNELEGVAPHTENTQSGFPNAKAISQRILTLPLHRFVRNNEISDIAKIFSRIMSDRPRNQSGRKKDLLQGSLRSR